MNSKSKIAIIGSGPGGALTAALLAEGGLDVVLFEAGADYSSSPIHSFSLEEMVLKYKNGGMTVALGNPNLSYIEGACLGGGSEINSGLYHRTPEEVLQSWRSDFGIYDFHDSSLLNYFKTNESELSVGLMPPDLIPKASLVLHRGAVSLGWKSAEIPRWFKYGAGDMGVRQSMSRTYIPRAISAGVKIFSRHKISKLSRKSNYWNIGGIGYDDGGNPFKIDFDAETIFLCGGAISTPFLLRSNYINSIAGKRLSLHPTVKIVAKFKDEVNSASMGVPVHQVKEFSPRVSFGCSISTPPYLSIALQGYESGVEMIRRDWKRMGIYYSMAQSNGGSVSSIPFIENPLVKFSLGNTGFSDALYGFLKLGLCLFAAGAQEIYPVVRGAMPIKSHDELVSFVSTLTPSQINLMTIHLFSSCPMGEDKNICVADSFGKVHGVDNLYINDSSLLCTSLGVNPQGTVMMLARRNCDIFLNG